MTNLADSDEFNAEVHRGHIFSNILAEDVATVNFCIEFIRFFIKSRKSGRTVIDFESSIDSTFQSTENTSSCSRSVQTNIKVTTECCFTIVQTFNIVLVTINFQLTFIQFSQVKFGEESSGQQQSSAICSGIVG